MSIHAFLPDGRLVIRIDKVLHLIPEYVIYNSITPREENAEF